MDFKDQVVLITGAGSSLGGVIAETFAFQQAILACHDLTPVNLDDTVGRIKAVGGRAEGYIFDLAKKMPVQAMVEQVMADWGRLDVLVVNSRVRPQSSILKMDEWDWHRTIDYNLGGPFFLIQSVGRIMKDLGGGAMVVLCEGMDQAATEPELAAYHASMRGVIGLMQTAAGELVTWKIRLNAVCMETEPMESKAYIGEKSHRVQETMQAIAEQVLYLCSPAAANLTGQVF